jgi:hypothetical protein
MKAYWGMEVQLNAFFDYGTRWRRVVSFTPRPLYPQVKSPWHPLDRKRKFLPNNHYTRRHAEGMAHLNGFKTTTLDGG